LSKIDLIQKMKITSLMDGVYVMTGNENIPDDNFSVEFFVIRIKKIKCDEILIECSFDWRHKSEISLQPFPVGLIKAN
jgi:hypothetical protein